jgi:hypothetical protein
MKLVQYKATPIAKQQHRLEIAERGTLTNEQDIEADARKLNIWP